MGEVINLDVVTTVDLPAEKVLVAAIAHDLKDVVVVGTREDGSLYFAGTSSDGPEVLWLLERAKRKLMDIVDDDSTDAPHSA